MKGFFAANGFFPPKLLAAGVGITLGADDPSYFDTDLTRELEQVHARLGLGLDVLDGFAERGLQAAFLRPRERDDRMQALHATRHAVRAAITARARR